jgi:hypothetical protein
MRKVTKEEVYKFLIKLYKWTFSEIANLNIWQQMLAADVSFAKGSDLVEFETEADYLRWKAGKDG